MKKNLLLLGASVVTAMGMTLLTLSLVLTASVAFAQIETDTCSSYVCKGGGGICASQSCDSTSCKCPDKPDANNKCPCGKK